MNNNQNTNQPQYIGNRQGTGFVNLQRVLQANQGNRLGSTIAGNVQSATQGVKTDLASQQDKFNQQLQQNTANTGANQQYTSGILNQAQNLGAGQDINQTDYTKFGNLLSGQYKGPTQIQDIQGLKSRAQEGQQIAQNIATPGGRFNLLQHYVGNNPNYSYGEQTLDSLLLGGKQNTQGLNQARRIGAGLNRDVNVADVATQGQAKQIAGENRAFGQQLGSQTSNLINQTQQTLNQKVATEQARYEQLKNALQNRQVSDTDLNNLVGQSTYNVDPTQFYSTIAPSLQNVATGSDVARINALNKLAGQQNNFLTNVDTNTYNPNQVFNTNEYQNAVNAARQDYQNYLGQQKTGEELQNLLGTNIGGPLQALAGLSQYGINPGINYNASAPVNSTGNLAGIQAALTARLTNQAYQGDLPYLNNAAQNEANLNLLQTYLNNLAQQRGVNDKFV